MIYNIGYEIAGLCVILALLVTHRNSYKESKKKHLVYIHLLSITILYCLVDVFTAITISYYYRVPYWTNYLSNWVLYFLIAYEGMLSWIYIRLHVEKRSILIGRISYIIFGIFALGWLVNPLTKWYFYLTSTGEYKRGVLYLTPTFVCYYFMFLAFAALIRNRKSYSPKRRFIQMLLMALAIFFVGFQRLNPTALVGGLAAVWTAVLSLFCFETPDFMKLQKKLVELQKSEEEATLAREEAELANNAKSTFLSNMSHQIRTPLNVIIGLDEMILRESANDEIRSYALKMQASSKALLGIVNDILDFSKIESGTMELTLDRYDLVDLVTVLVTMEKSRAKKKNLELKVELDETLPRYLRGDSIRLRQIITNLLTNAIKYTEVGSVTLRMTGERCEGKLDLKVEVDDTGIGIKEEDMPKLFMEFERIEEDRNRSIEGTGLGMNITVSLLKLMGSSLEIASTYGEGSCFGFTVLQEIEEDTPVGDIHEQINLKAKAYSYEASFSAPRARILAVDDKEMNLFVLQNLLKKTRVQITTCLSGREAIDILKDETYDLILMDHMMPEMDGIEVLQYLRKEEMCNETPIVVLTANAMVGVEKTYLEAGFDAYLSKPINQEELENTIRALLPEDLIENALESEEEEITLTPEQKEKYEALSKLTNIEIKDAVDALGSPEVYLDVVERYALSLEDTIGEIRELLNGLTDSEEIKAYRIVVHSLKSSSKMAGFLQLSQLALDAEEYAREESVDDILANSKALLEEAELVDAELKAIYQVEEEFVEGEIDVKAIIDTLESIRFALDNTDIDMMDEEYENLSQLPMPQACYELRTPLKKAINDLDADEGNVIIDQMLAYLKEVD